MVMAILNFQLPQKFEARLVVHAEDPISKYVLQW
jgi:hypothetical protein